MSAKLLKSLGKSYNGTSQREATAILKRARDLVGKGWIKGYWARDAEGDNVHYSSPAACQFCAEGAIDRAIFEVKPKNAVSGQLARARFEYVFGGRSVIERNDSKTTTKEQVFGCFDFAYRGAAGF